MVETEGNRTPRPEKRESGSTTSLVGWLVLSPSAPPTESEVDQPLILWRPSTASGPAASRLCGATPSPSGKGQRAT